MKSLGLAVGPAGAADVRTLVPVQPEPAEVLENALLGRLGRSLGVGVLDAQHIGAVVPARQQPVEERRARVAHVQLAGRTGSEADSHLLTGALPRTPARSLAGTPAPRSAPSRAPRARR